MLGLRPRSGLKGASFLAVGLMLGLSLAACGSPSSTGAKGSSQSSTPKAYEFAMIMPMTGSNAGYGMDQVRSAEMAVQKINASGGVDGIPLKMITLDSQASAQIGVTAFQKAVGVNNVPIVVTAWSSVVAAIAPFANQDHVLTFSDGANDPSIANLRPYVRTLFPLSSLTIPTLAKYTYNNLHKHTAAIVYVNNSTGTPANNLYAQAFEAAGGKVLLNTGVPQDTSDFTAVIDQLRSLNPQVIHLQLLEGGIEQFPAQARAAGITSLLTSYEAAQDPVLVQKSPQAANGIVFFTTTPQSSPAISQFLQDFKAKYGRLPNGPTYCEYLYDAPFAVKAVIQQMHKMKLAYTGANALKALNVLGPITTPLTGTIKFNSDGTVSKPVYINEIKNGKFVQIAVVNPK